MHNGAFLMAQQWHDERKHYEAAVNEQHGARLSAD
jgi:hypothetical protein